MKSLKSNLFYCCLFFTCALVCGFVTASIPKEVDDFINKLNEEKAIKATEEKKKTEDLFKE